MSYKIKITDCVNVKQRKLYHSWNCQPSGARQKRKNPTSEEVREYNTKRAIEKLYFKMCRNFTQNDLYLTVTYKPDINKSINSSSMKKNLKRFLRLMRAYYRKQGREFKYIYTYGISENSFRHYHLIINCIEEDIINECWKKATPDSGIIKIKHLWKDFDYMGLAKYFVENGSQAVAFDGAAFKQLYSCSRNLINPTVTVEKVTSSNTFSGEILIDSGYELDEKSIRNGFDCYGFRFFQYNMIKRE
ncbi:MAG: hypothetical protein ACI4GY_04605 [Acutalibacteraceae bacterium]